MNAAVEGDKSVPGDALELEGPAALRRLMMRAVVGLVPGGTDKLVGNSLHNRGASSLAFNKAAVQAKNTLMERGLVSCCNPNCTSLRRVSELGLVSRAEASSKRFQVMAFAQVALRLVTVLDIECQQQQWAAGHKEMCGALAVDEQITCK
jgi:hypothetical protein